MVCSFNMALLQLDTQDDKAANLKRIGEMIDEAASKRAQFICMPEMANYIGIGDGPFQNAEDVPGGPTADLFRDKAKQHGVWIHGGSIPERIAGEKRVYNTTVVFNPKGEIVAKYRKIHLYDINVKNGISFMESDSIKAGDDIVNFDSEFGPMGLAICYDIRFPELYRLLALRGAKLIFNPAEFNIFTGKDHWECLVRARARSKTSATWSLPGSRTEEDVSHLRALDRRRSLGQCHRQGERPGVRRDGGNRHELCRPHCDQVPCIKNRRPETYK